VGFVLVIAGFAFAAVAPSPTKRTV
jgi:hypothetical protein